MMLSRSWLRCFFCCATQCQSMLPRAVKARHGNVVNPRVDRCA